MYYKLIKEAHGPQLASTTKGRQALAGQHMKDRQGNQRTTTKEGMEARWIEHFTDLFNQPGVLGEGIDLSMPARRAVSPKIKTGAFNMAELHTAIKDMDWMAMVSKWRSI